MTKVTFSNKSNTFYTSVKTAVDQYFAAHRIKKTGNWKLYMKAGILLPGALLIYTGLLLFFHRSAPASHFTFLPVFIGIFACTVLGLVLASTGFNVMHDACHGSYSTRGWVNDSA